MKHFTVILLMLIPLSLGAKDFKEQYISRGMTYMSFGESIALTDPRNPRVITLDPWPEWIFFLSDGVHTVEQLMVEVESQYKNGIPKDVRDTVTSVIKQLEKEKIIVLRDEPKKLPYYLEVPKEKWDSELAKKLMLQDGFIKAE